ncbi:hypothetical protein [Aeoliella sp.]|uniref:hypothetical protein n=1 Tax=Aeoliella sp. TaxID=2795800 RepID=UPI003CCB9F06
MKSDRKVRIVAPGLPSHPPLMFDPRERSAKVTLRHSTWKSVEWAIYTTELSTWVTLGLLVWLLWVKLPISDPMFRALVLLYAMVLPFYFVRFTFPLTLQPFLARQVFCTRTTLRFTPHLVVIRSHLFARPVVIWREWKTAYVKIRFVVQPDREAIAYAGGLGPKRRFPTDHLRDSRMLEVVLTTVYRNRSIDFDRQGSLLRSIPITEADSRLAMQMTMVYAAAVILTAPDQKPSSSQPTGGTDIDAL